MSIKILNTGNEIMFRFMQYCMFYMHRHELHVKVPYCVYIRLPEDELTRFETCWRQHKLKIKC
jgi:hypothetical protein